VRLAFVSIPCFASAVELQRRPAFSGRPLIVGDAEQPKRVLDCSAEASRCGVRPEMTVRKALAQCPDALVIPPDPVLYSNCWRAILDSFQQITPEIEDLEMGRAYLNVAGLRRHYGDETSIGRRILEAVREVSGLDGSVGLAEGKLPAFVAAVTLPPGQVGAVPPGREAGFLAPLSTSLLPVTGEVLGRLQMLGLDLIGEVARLSSPELQSQFGFEGARLWRLANGIDDEPLRPRPYAERIADSLSFEAPVAGIEVMVAAAKQLFSRLRLSLRGRAARELTLQAELASGRGWERRLVFREAVSENERLIFLLRSTLQNAPPPAAIRSLTLCLSGLTLETGKQLTLGEKGRLQRQLEECIRQLKARYGYSPVYRCVDVESWSVIPEERQILVESDA
jgi:nucleotidyltransferase/DNA polymerase involved in DNA repair